MSDPPPTRVPKAIAELAPDGRLTPRQARRILLDVSLRKQKPGTGSSLEFLTQRTAMNPWPDLRSVLRGIRWVIVGGVATRAYMPERMTRDLDILVSADDGPEVVNRLKAAGYEVISPLGIPGYLVRSPEGVEVDVLFGALDWLAQALAHPNQDAAGYPVIALPYLILLKLAAMRAQDTADICRMLGQASETDLSAVRKAVSRYSPLDSEDLESMIFIGKREFGNAPGSPDG